MTACVVRHTGAAAAFAAVAVCALLVGTPRVASAQPPARSTAADRDALRSRIEARYEIVPLRDGIGLRPKNRGARIRMIEISGGSISIDGAEVSGRELRDRVGEDADLIIPLSYYDPAQRGAFLGPAEERAAPTPAPREEPAPEPPPPAADRDVTRHRVGERVRIFGDVSIARDESVSGDAVAVIGSVRVDGRVSGDVVAVLGEVELGPDARVTGDVTSVGGGVHKSDSAQIGGRITEVDVLRGANIGRGWRWRAPIVYAPFGGTARLFGTVLRFFVLGLVVSIAVLVGRGPVEWIGRRIGAEPIKMAAIGLLAQLLFLPAFILTIVILAISIVGIPLLLLTPFLFLALLVILLGGFAGAAYTAGGWAAQRAGWSAEEPFLRAWLGVLIVLTPLFIARLLGLIGGPFSAAAFLVAALATLFEYAVWTTGLGAALVAAVEGWRHRRTPPAAVAVPPVGTPAPPAP